MFVLCGFSLHSLFQFPVLYREFSLLCLFFYANDTNKIWIWECWHIHSQTKEERSDSHNTMIQSLTMKYIWNAQSIQLLYFRDGKLFKWNPCMKYEMKKKKNEVLNSNHNEWNVMKTHEVNENGYNGSRRTHPNACAKWKVKVKQRAFLQAQPLLPLGAIHAIVCFL